MDKEKNIVIDEKEGFLSLEGKEDKRGYAIYFQPVDGKKIFVCFVDVYLENRLLKNGFNIK